MTDPNEKPSYKDIARWSSSIAGYWKFLAAELDLPEEMICNIAQSSVAYPTVQDQALQMLQGWRETGNATYRKMAEALRTLDKGDLADAICPPQGDSLEKAQHQRKCCKASKIIKGVELGLKVLKEVLVAIGSISRKCAVGIDNESGDKWNRASLFFESGTSDEVPPYELENEFAVLYPTRKTKGAARGSIGVMCWCAENSAYTVCVLFSVPYDYNWYSNWWNVKLYDGCKTANYDIYYELYYDANPFKGDFSWKERDLGRGLKMRGCMAASGDATLEVHVEKK